MAKQLISAQECKEILWKAVNIQANETDIQHELNVMDNSFGFIADLAHLTIWMGKGNDEETREEFKFFVKLVPLDSNGKIRRSELTWMFEREAFMYADILLKFNAAEATHWHPKCYLARKDLLVLENLNLSGFKHLAHRTRFDCPLVECVLRSVAAIHADSIAYETKIHPRNIVDAFGEYREEFGIAPDKIWFQRGLEAIKAIIPMTQSYQRCPEKYRIPTFDKLVFPIYEMVKPSSKYRNVFCHQDLWAGNIMFNFSQINGKDNLSEPVSCVLMDYQFPRYVPPIADVLQLIFMTTRRSHRQKHLLNYCRFYYQCLHNELKRHGLNGETVLSWDDFRASYEDLKLMPMVYNCVALPFTYFPNEIQMKIKSSEAEEFRRVREENHHDYIIKYMEQDVEFKDVVLESIEELMEALYE